jgi:hypothetical protein
MYRMDVFIEGGNRADSLHSSLASCRVHSRHPRAPPNIYKLLSKPIMHLIFNINYPPCTAIDPVTWLRSGRTKSDVQLPS